MKSDPKPAYWAVIPGELRRDDAIPANAKLLYGDISALTGERGYCFAGNEYLAGLYGWTERSVQRLIAALAERGYIRVEMVPGKERRIYAGAFLGPPPGASPQGGDKNVTPDKKVVGGTTKLSPPNNVDNKTVDIPPKSPKGGKRGVSTPKWRPDKFEQFWEYYRTHGRGDDRAGAVREWDRLKPDDDLLRIMGQALAAHVRSDDWRRGYIPYARTWLYNRRWEDTGRKAAPPAGAAPGGEYSDDDRIGSDLPLC